MTSRTMTRSWLAAVVWSRSIASVATVSAVSNPNVCSQPQRSLSIVFGTPMARTPYLASSLAMPWLPSPPITTRASMPSRRALPASSL